MLRRQTRVAQPPDAETLGSPGAFVMPNPWDAGTTRVLTGLGYPALATTSGGLAFALGRRDGESAVTRAEALEHAALIVSATHLPVSGDLANGSGDDPEDVAETIRGAATAGLVGFLALPGCPSVEVLAAAGVRRISLGTGFVRTALGAFLRAAKDVHEHGTFGSFDGAATSSDLEPFMQD